MTLPASFTIGLLEKIGTPLVASIESVAGAAAEGVEIDTSTILAQMLGQAVQSSISLSASVDMPPDEMAADSARLGLAALMASVLADFYRTHKRVPVEADIARMVKSMQSVAAFGENFSAAKDQASRLSLLGKDTLIFDGLQVNLVTMQLMTPVMNAIAGFPFGQSETKLLQEVLDKLKNYAQNIVNITGDASKLAEMMTLKSLAQIYAECHISETERLMKVSDEARASVTIDSVWIRFDKRLAMAEAMVGINDEGRGTQTTASSGGPAPIAPAVPPAAPVIPVTAAPPETPTPAVPPPIQTPPPTQVQAVAPAQTAPPAGGSPMGFFKPKTEGAEAPAVPVATAQETPAQTAPIAPPPVEVQTPPPVAPVTAAAPATPPTAEASAGGGSPMSFFKTKKEGEA